MEQTPSEHHVNHAGKATPNAIALLSYLWLLFVVPLLTAKDDAFVKFHLKQGLVLFVFEVIVWVVTMIPFLGWLVGWLGWIAAVILSIIGILNVLHGEEKELPFIGKYAENFKI
jgi:uncharacterized membrane protein